MKKKILGLLVIAAIAVFSNSCKKEEESFDESLLTGKWQLVGGTEIYRYNADGTGVFWDPADDVSEAEGQQFTWTLEKSDFTHIHLMEVGGNVTKYYKVTELTSNSLKYKDTIENTSYSYTKI